MDHPVTCDHLIFILIRFNTHCIYLLFFWDFETFCHLRSTPANETPTPLQKEGKFLAFVAYPLLPLLVSDLDKPSPWLETTIFVDLYE